MCFLSVWPPAQMYEQASEIQKGVVKCVEALSEQLFLYLCIHYSLRLELFAYACSARKLSIFG